MCVRLGGLPLCNKQVLQVESIDPRPRAAESHQPPTKIRVPNPQTQSLRSTIPPHSHPPLPHNFNWRAPIAASKVRTQTPVLVHVIGPLRHLDNPLRPASPSHQSDCPEPKSHQDFRAASTGGCFHRRRVQFESSASIHDLRLPKLTSMYSSPSQGGFTPTEIRQGCV
jgi:hypothetical protein